MTTTSSASLTKNDDGSYTYGRFLVLAPVYDRTIKRHIFNIISNGCIPIRHEGNFLTLRSSIKKLTEGVVPSERTEPLSLGAMLGIKPDETLTADQLLAEIAPVYYAPDLISNAEIVFPDFGETIDPLLLAMRAVIADPADKELYGALRAHLDEVLCNAIEL